MNLTIIKQCIVYYYKEECGIHIQGDTFPKELSILPLFNDGLQGLEKGTGHPEQELEKINSSARLAAFYYKLLEMSGGFSSLRFEWNESTPLEIPGRENPPANLDVRYEENNEVHFVESKYLEPYYSENEKIKNSYLNQDYYSDSITNSNLWVEKFSEVSEMTRYVNVSQLYRHLLAIYRHYQENLQSYMGKTIILESVSWKPTEQFLDSVGKLSKRSRSYLIKRMDLIEQELEAVKKDINAFIKILKWDNCRFETKSYNNMLDSIKDSPKFNDFCKQYFLK
jgi:hypothetical protein